MEHNTGYPGNKYSYGSYQQIINEIPPHQNFISLFLGTCAVMKMKKPAPGINIGFDLSRAEVDNFNLPAAVCFNFNALQFLENASTLSMDLRDTFIYADPPYYLGSRRSSKNLYTFEMSTQDHVDFLNLIKQISGPVAISHYQTDLYNHELKGWRIKTWRTMTHAGPATEALYMNYTEPERLHEYTFLGKNKTDRQRIRRKLAALNSKLNNLPPRERNAIIEVISNRQI